MLDGVSEALHQVITIEGGAAKESNFTDYPLMRIAESFLYRDVISGDQPDVETATTAIGLLFTAQATQPSVSPAGTSRTARRSSDRRSR